MTRVEGENTRLRHYLARLHRKTLCYSKYVKMLENSLKLLIHYLKFKDVPVFQFPKLLLNSSLHLTTPSNLSSHLIRIIGSSLLVMLR